MACICQRYKIVAPSARAFSTTTRQNTSLHIKSNLRDDIANLVPEYPYEAGPWYKQGQRGLYGGSKIQFGNTTGEKNMPRARRSWSLNVKRKRLYSEALDQTVQLQVTTRVLRTINKYGGLDEYLLGEKPARIKELGETGWWLRWAIMQTDSVKARFKEQTDALMAEYQQGGVEAPSGLNIGEESLGIEQTSTVQTSEGLETPASDDVAEEAVSTLDTEQQSQTAVPSARRLRRITFRVDRGKHVVFNGRTWEARYKRAQRAAWQRDLAKVSQLQQQRKPSDEAKLVTESAAQYIQTSLRNKKLQRGMPPSVVSHRRWLKQSGAHIQANARPGANASLQRTLLDQSLRHQNQAVIARAIARRTQANEFRR